MAVSSRYSDGPDGGTHQGTPPSLLAHMPFNEERVTEGRCPRTAGPRLPLGREGAKDLNFGVQQASSVDKAFQTPGTHTAMKCSTKTYHRVGQGF